MKEEHFIRDIEIKNFKCFEDFKADGFGRVNLIGGKNNMGKTAFMEAVYLIQNASEFSDPEDRELFYFQIIKWLLIIEGSRKTVDFLLDWIKDEIDLMDFPHFNISKPKKFNLTFAENYIRPEKSNGWNYGTVEIDKYRDNKYFYKIYKKNSPPQIANTTFISPCSANHINMKDMIDTLKIENKYDYINNLFSEIFKVKKIDVINNKVMVQENGIFKNLNDYGDGLKHFLNIILSLLVNKDNVIYLDEIDNGIHYTNLDKLWELILKISKQQNVQVFATTHSKECIESYTRVAKRLEDKEIAFIELGKNDENEITSIVYEYDEIINQVEQHQDIRGW